MTKYVWTIAKAAFEWTPTGINYSDEELMNYVNDVYFEGKDSWVDELNRSPMWELENGFDTPEHFAALLSRCFGINIQLRQAPKKFTKWFNQNIAPYHPYDCGLGG